jgi:putative heme-binding domain-containing protein
VRLTAVEGLGEARDTNAAPRLRDRFTQDPNPAVRRAALNALGAIRDPDTAPLVAAAVRNRDTDSALLFEAVDLAPKWKSAEVSAALIELLKRITAPPALRLAAIDALARSGGEDAATALREALKAADIEERRAAIRALGKLRDKAAVPDLLAAWASPATRAEALGALTRFSDPRALDAYLDGLSSADPVVREQCRKALAPIRAEALPEIETRGASFSAPVLAELRRIYANDPEALKKPLFASGAKMLEAGDYEGYARTHAGIAGKGERIFFNEQGVGCSRCHSVEGHGGGIGPDLTMAGAQFSRAQLIESVLYPSRAVREGYQQIVVETKDDESISGVLKAETADGLTLVDAGGRTNFVTRASIVDRRASELSLMPEGLQVGLTLDEFADLIGYLESRKAEARNKSP